MKNRKNRLTAVLFMIALALAPVVQAAPQLADDGSSTGPEVALPAITIHSTDNVTRGKIGTFVLNMNSAPGLILGGMYVKFSVSGSAIPGLDYVALLSPAHIGQSGYGVIQVQTLADPRGGLSRQAYSVVVTLEPGPGYAVGKPSSATMWIKQP
jgi:hypothetical protein